MRTFVVSQWINYNSDFQSSQDTIPPIRLCLSLWNWRAGLSRSMIAKNFILTNDYFSSLSYKPILILLVLHTITWCCCFGSIIPCFFPFPQFSFDSGVPWCWGSLIWLNAIDCKSFNIFRFGTSRLFSQPSKVLHTPVSFTPLVTLDGGMRQNIFTLIFVFYL